MAFRSLIGGSFRSTASRPHRHLLKTSTKIVGLVGPIDHNHHHQQRLLRNAIAPSSPFHIQIPAGSPIRGQLIGGSSPVPGAHEREDIILFAKFAVIVKNETENANLQFVRVVRAQATAVAGFKYKIILEVIDGEDGETKCFSATVLHQAWLNRVQVLKWETVFYYPKRKLDEKNPKVKELLEDKNMENSLEKEIDVASPLH